MFGEIPDFLVAWLEKQQMFWVASAPLTADGLVNISPKGVEGTFRIASSRRVWYEDLSGSVPFYDFKGHRTQLLEWAAKKEAADRDAELTVGFSSATSPRIHTGLKCWWEERNTTSLDGLQGIVLAHMSDKIFRSRPIEKKSSYDISTIQFKAIRAFDFRILCAFLVGILVTYLYQRLTFITKNFIFIN
ncbi:hypothetical protein C0993_011401 [Termitomyces sp. T159_Od127]|nr:hypothetical protein C0993_011401 [Termitomyces sp. T159_Od127]